MLTPRKRGCGTARRYLMKGLVSLLAHREACVTAGHAQAFPPHTHTHFQSVFLISDMIEYSTFDCPFDFRSLVLRIRCATTFLFTCYAPQHDAKRPTKIAKILQAACGTAHSSRCHPGALMPTPAASLTLPQRSGSIRRCVCTHVCISLFVSIDGLAVEKRTRPPFARPLACVLTACIRDGVAGRRVCDARTGQDGHRLPVAERGVGRHGLRRCVLRVPQKHRASTTSETNHLPTHSHAPPCPHRH